MTNYEMLLHLGMDEKEVAVYQSDLYVKLTTISMEFVDNYKFRNSVTTFKNTIDNSVWFDIPFGNMDGYISDRVVQLVVHNREDIREGQKVNGLERIR